MDNSPEKSPEPCLFLGLVRVGKPRIPARHAYQYYVKILRGDAEKKKNGKGRGIKKSTRLFHTNNVTSSEVDVLILKAWSLVVQVVGLSKNLQSYALSRV